MTHRELVERAYQWLRGTQKCQFAMMEPGSIMNKEIPDAIGWKNGESILVECKVSQPDLDADKRKRFRKNPVLGMGRYRYYMVEPGIKVGNIYNSWGLLVVKDGRVYIERISERFDEHNYTDEARLLSLRAAHANGGFYQNEQAEATEAERKLHEIKEIYIGIEGFDPETAPEGYLQKKLEEMYNIAAGIEKDDGRA